MLNANGTLSKENAAQIFNNVLKIRKEIYEKYHIEERNDTRPVETQNNRINPRQLSELSQDAMRRNPGKLSRLVGKVKEIIGKALRKERYR